MRCSRTERTSDSRHERPPQEIEVVRLRTARAELNAMLDETHPSLDIDSIMREDVTEYYVGIRDLNTFKWAWKATIFK